MAGLGFQVPSTLPQDLQLIQDIVGQLLKPKDALRERHSDSDSIASSDTNTDSEGEVEACILDDNTGKGNDVVATSEGSSEDSDESSDSCSSDDEPTDNAEVQMRTKAVSGLHMIEDDEDGGDVAASSLSVVRTKNELNETEFKVPESDEVGEHENLELVGEIISVVGDVVIVRGETRNETSRGPLDADTLLTFEDRKVLGYVYETFGPTSQPFYQVRFGEKFPLDPQRVYASRPVFHIPQRSKYVSVYELRRLKGSDASNLHDEEVADYELEFSDDEQEAAHKARLRQQRQNSREPSSRYSTPTPSQMRDADMLQEFSSNPYDEHGIYDVQSAQPSRPAALPYDDPYSDGFGISSLGSGPSLGSSPSSASTSMSLPRKRSPDIRGRGRGRGRGHDGRHDRGGPRGRGRGRGRGGNTWGRPNSQGRVSSVDSAGQVHQNSLSPGQARQEVPWNPSHNFQSQLQGVGYPPAQSELGFVQPHINPRFAAQFGFDPAWMQQQQYFPPQHYDANWPTSPGGGNANWGRSSWGNGWNSGGGTGGG